MRLRRTAEAGKAAVKAAATRFFFRSRAFRMASAAAIWPKRRHDGSDLSHLALYTEQILGPVQRDEALFLHSLIRVVRPATVVEIGLRGHSAFKFLRALDPDARLCSFDIKPACAQIARDRFGHDPRFTFRMRSQTEIAAADIDGRTIDFIFLDAAHDADLNRATFERLLPLMAPDVILAVHDTGTIPRRFIPTVIGGIKSQSNGWETKARSRRANALS